MYALLVIIFCFSLHSAVAKGLDPAVKALRAVERERFLLNQSPDVWREQQVDAMKDKITQKLCKLSRTKRATEDERLIIGYSVLANALQYQDYNYWLAQYVGGARDNLPTRMAYLALTMLTMDGLEARSGFLQSGTTMQDRIFAKTQGNETWQKLVYSKESRKALFFRQLDKFRDLFNKVFPAAYHINKEIREQSDSRIQGRQDWVSYWAGIDPSQAPSDHKPLIVSSPLEAIVTSNLAAPGAPSGFDPNPSIKFFNAADISRPLNNVVATITGTNTEGSFWGFQEFPFENKDPAGGKALQQHLPSNVEMAGSLPITTGPGFSFGNVSYFDNRVYTTRLGPAQSSFFKQVKASVIDAARRASRRKYDNKRPEGKSHLSAEDENRMLISYLQSKFEGYPDTLLINAHYLWTATGAYDLRNGKFSRTNNDDIRLAEMRDMVTHIFIAALGQAQHHNIKLRVVLVGDINADAEQCGFSAIGDMVEGALNPKFAQGQRDYAFLLSYDRNSSISTSEGYVMNDVIVIIEPMPAGD